MKRLFDDDEEFTDEARKISSELENSIERLFFNYSDYSTRDIANLIHRAVNHGQSIKVLWDRRKRAEENKKGKAL